MVAGEEVESVVATKRVEEAMQPRLTRLIVVFGLSYAVVAAVREGIFLELDVVELNVSIPRRRHPRQLAAAPASQHAPQRTLDYVDLRCWQPLAPLRRLDECWRPADVTGSNRIFGDGDLDGAFSAYRRQRRAPKCELSDVDYGVRGPLRKTRTEGCQRRRCWPRSEARSCRYRKPGGLARGAANGCNGRHRVRPAVVGRGR